MEINKVKLIYFSPTGTTRKVLESIAQGIAEEDVEHIDLTLPHEARQNIPLFSNELVIIGAPVYGGRLPVDAINRFKQIQASNTLAVLIVVYGNREYEDALLELKDLAIEFGFLPLAGGAFIGEHSFSTKDIPIASGRPDNLDIQKARSFGADIKARVKALPSPDALLDLKVPGRFPYEGGANALFIAPVVDHDTCTVCGTCAGVCPTAAITIQETVETRTELCIRCCACIRICPVAARSWQDSRMHFFTNWLHENCSARKEPQLFLG